MTHKYSYGVSVSQKRVFNCFYPKHRHTRWLNQSRKFCLLTRRYETAGSVTSQICETVKLFGSRPINSFDACSGDVIVAKCLNIIVPLEHLQSLSLLKTYLVSRQTKLESLCSLELLKSSFKGT